jgi:hypothetical protein
MTPRDVRTKLIDALETDLVGPRAGSPLEAERIHQSPSRWYLTGFLVPYEAPTSHKQDDVGDDQMELVDAGGADDNLVPESQARARAFFPSSMGVSVLIAKATDTLQVEVLWGTYARLPNIAPVDHGPGRAHESERWQRTQHRQTVAIDLKKLDTQGRAAVEVPQSDGLSISVSSRAFVTDGDADDLLPNGTRAVSLFVVNHRDPGADDRKDEGFAFQVEMEVRCAEGFVARPNLRGADTDDADEQIADLQYRNVFEYAVGHNVATRATLTDGKCSEVRTTWTPTHEVEKVVHGDVSGVDLGMASLAACSTADAVRTKLQPMIDAYAAWVKAQAKFSVNGSKQRKGTLTSLLKNADGACERIADGLKALDDPHVLEAFRVANRVMAAQSTQRSSWTPLEPGRTASPPSWRLFQIAFLVMNLRAMREAEHPSRGVVDLIFFPTGGGKTEAYLGLAAYTMVLRRLMNPKLTSAGVSVLMRYTLRLLTLDQLGRAATLMCALELERQKNVDTLGTWPFEIGLWVGRAATPNRMGRKGDDDEHSARTKTRRFQLDSARYPSPIPLENCPWCNEKFKPASFTLHPNPDTPLSLRVVCLKRGCAFNGDNPLPIVAVDEAIYRRVPALVIATVDKFAALPWTGHTGALFGKVDRCDKEGFYGPCDPGVGKPIGAVPGTQLPPPDLIIQDELHLISGPLGTMAGLYEGAIEALCARDGAENRVLPKIVASTATVRQAQKQIQALFARPHVHVFPPPGPDLRDSFFAKTVPVTKKNGRQYVGIAAQGRSAKVILLRTYLALLAAAEKAWREAGGDKVAKNPADPYMTLLGYFSSLRELGGSRRIVEDEVRTRLHGYGDRKRIGEAAGLFAERRIAYEVSELTSRETTDKVSETKRRLALGHNEKEHIDVAMATNMISVGLDITRLGLMVVLGQPKATAEYIQATSRVGRDDERPGLVVTLFNLYKPRDRSHYERFEAYHQTFYRSVEATSVTPFSPRAIERALAAITVALARHEVPAMTAARAAIGADTQRPQLDFISDVIAARALEHARLSPEAAEDLRKKTKAQVADLLDAWAKLASGQKKVSAGLQYAQEEGNDPPLLHTPLDPALKDLPDPRWKRFTANRSLRDVEPSVNLWLGKLDDSEVDDASTKGGA